MKKITPETLLKHSCIKLLADCGGWSFPVPPGGRRSRGIKGAPDRICFSQGVIYAVEFKAPKGKLSVDQKNVKLLVESTGCKYNVIRSVPEFIDALNLPVLFGREP